MRPPRAIYVLSVLFFLQAWFFGIFVTLQGDIPDESGHYAYVIDITKGRPLPVLGQTDKGRGVISNNLWRDWGLPDGDRYNYIVQHPPLYYAVAAIPYSIAKHFTNNKVRLAQATRVVSAICLGLLIFVCFRILTAVGVEERLAIAVASWFGFIPTVTHLASGITNDIFLTLMCALASLQLVRYLASHRLANAYGCAFWLACVGATKMTGWVLIAGILGILIFELRRTGWKWLLHAAILSLISCSTALWWMRRNIFFFGDPFYVGGSDGAVLATHYTRTNYLEQQPFFDWLFLHFYGLEGFSGFCNSAESLAVLERFCHGVRITVVQGISLNIFIWVGVACATLLLGATLFRVLRTAPANHEEASIASMQGLIHRGLTRIHANKWLPATLLVLALGGTAWVYAHAFKLDPRYAYQIQAVAALLAITGIAGLVLVFLSSSADSRLLAYGPILLCLFTLLLFLKGHEAYVIAQRAAGIQGRYLYPFIPLLLASFGIAIRQMRFALPLCGLVTALLAWAHLNAEINTLIPFFNMVRL
ncbi:DUF2142 domain-containing protein [Hydrogenophaga sp. PAMC20947]|uniref:glycosyltransferase family 39 protein n=1 Tax=Hydrogenophaga sp. PAMC20947 TaxID=2565558 RepID=UPI00109DBA08|nr:DUF2142 domain-containing protein [Hydrogenophaga sp. PAMC20947]QCB46321.1 DUF2142 domain-containing protein [Hydrogenophaga sp. PAMC20947]